MDILKLGGMDQQLYKLVAPLVMNPAILRQNNNYPFKTSRNHIWYIAIENKHVVGFIPVKTGSKTNLIDNYYICGDDPQIVDGLLERIIPDFPENDRLSALVHKRHTDLFTAHGFQTIKEWSKYDKMTHNIPTEDDETTECV